MNDLVWCFGGAVLVLEGGATWTESFPTVTLFTTYGIRTGLGLNPDLCLKPATLRQGHIMTQCNIMNYGRVSTVRVPVSLGVLTPSQLRPYANFCSNQVKASAWVTDDVFISVNLPRKARRVTHVWVTPFILSRADFCKIRMWPSVEQSPLWWANDAT
jgi:hypothetical protein